MIRYLITFDELKALIGEGWLKKAKTRTTKFKKQGFYKENSSIWSEVKHIYMTLQGESKCIFCERKLESVTFGKGEQAVEHFRPKGNVKTWDAVEELVKLGISFTAAAEKNSGYYLLAYYPLNYTASCNPCNSVLKSSYFPIAGDYNLQIEDMADFLKEKPYLIYPVGDFDEDPEDLIGFYGVTPFAKPKEGFSYQRALVTINFFKLNDVEGRKNLFQARAFIIIALYAQLEILNNPTSTASEKKTAEKLIKGFTSPKAPHTNCARSFVKLYETNRAEAQERQEEAVEWISSTS